MSLTRLTSNFRILRSWAGLLKKSESRGLDAFTANSIFNTKTCFEKKSGAACSNPLIRPPTGELFFKTLRFINCFSNHSVSAQKELSICLVFSFFWNCVLLVSSISVRSFLFESFATLSNNHFSVDLRRLISCWSSFLLPRVLDNLLSFVSSIVDIVY